MRRINKPILFLFLLFGCGLQKEDRSALVTLGGIGVEELPPLQQPSPLETQISKEQENTKTTSCCLCQKKADNENEVWPYVSQQQCETRNQVGPYENCKIIQVQENVCRFLEVKSSPNALTGFSCIKHSLHQIENGTKKTLLPPNPISGPCGLVRTSSIPLPEPEKMAHKSKINAEIDTESPTSKPRGKRIVCNEKTDGTHACQILSQD